MKKPPQYPTVKNPSTRFFFVDLDEEKTLRMCSMAARGLWSTHMLRIMAESAGYLAYNGKPMTTAQLAGWVGASVADVDGWLGELDANGVFSRDRHGTPYNRRMLKAQKKARSNAENGRLGGRPKSYPQAGEDDDGNEGTLFDAENGSKTPQKRGPRKSLELNGNSDLQTQKKPNHNPTHNPNDQPRARVLTKTTSSNHKSLNSDREEKNPARAGYNGRGVIGPDKVLARLCRATERPDDDDGRAWAMTILMNLEISETRELSEYATPAPRVVELVSKAENHIDGLRKEAAAKRTKSQVAH